MAGRSKPPKRPESKRVVALVMERLGARNDEDLARELGMPPYDKDAIRKAQRWISGDNAPYFDELMLMLSKARLIDPELDRRWRGVVADAPVTDDQEEDEQRQAG